MLSNPFLQNKNIIYYIMVWVLVLGAHFVLLYYFFNLSLAASFLDGFIFNFIFGAFGLGLWYTVRYINVEHKSVFVVFLNHLSAAIIISFCWVFASYFFLKLLIDDNYYLNFLNGSLTWRVLLGLFFYALTILIYYVIIFYGQYQEKKIKEAELVIKARESELKRLRAQINPHFIFNTLNSISSLTMIAPGKAQEMVIKLSDFLRYSLKNEVNKKVSCKEELENVKLYLEIEKTRFGDRFIYTETIEPECLNKFLPDMILQPLFENALKHGVYDSIDVVEIQFTCTCDAEYLYISLSNSISQNQKRKKGTGTGITNIQNQMRLTYGRNDLLKINKDDKTFEVALTVPQA